MFKWISKKLTKNYSNIPLLYINFNLNKYQQNGVKNSCIIKIHPELKDDKHIIKTLNDLIDYVRDNYDMENLSK